eukprot:1068257-Amorphochlora_amoeboformis.AAC.1
MILHAAATLILTPTPKSNHNHKANLKRPPNARRRCITAARVPFGNGVGDVEENRGVQSINHPDQTERALEDGREGTDKGGSKLALETAFQKQLAMREQSFKSRQEDLSKLEKKLKLALHTIERQEHALKNGENALEE